VEFYVEVDHIHNAGHTACESAFAGMATFGNTDNISYTFNVHRICTYFKQQVVRQYKIK
jgi:hypothetical protein